MKSAFLKTDPEHCRIFYKKIWGLKTKCEKNLSKIHLQKFKL